MKKRLLLTASFVLPAAMAFSAGYQLNLQGLRQLAMGGGGVAMPWDAATLFYNPAGLSRLDGIQVYGSGLLIVPRVEYANAATGSVVRAQNQTFTPFNVYLGGSIKGVKGLGAGIGIYTPFGSGIKWDDNWTGRYLTQNILLETFFVQPTLSYQFNDAISIGGGFVYAFGKVNLSKAVPVQELTTPDGQATLDGKAHGTGYNVGVSLKASDRLRFGISYRSRVDMHADNGTVSFSNIPATVAGNFPNTSFDATLPLPEVLSVGAAWKAMDRLTLQLDFNLVGWKAYDTLAFNYGAAIAGSTRNANARLYSNRLATRLGAHYKATERLAIMLGAAYDPSPARDGYISPDLPDANRITLSGGISYRPSAKLTILAAVEYLTSDKRDASYNDAAFSGTYQLKAITPGIGITYDF